MKNQNETQINGLIIVSASLAAMLLTVSATISAVNATTVPSECQSHNGNNTNVHCTAGQKLPQQPTTLPGANDVRNTSSGSGSSQHVGRHHSGSSSLSTSSSGRGLVQIPSIATDFPNNDPKVIQVRVTSAKKDIIGDYHIVGEITNTGNDTFSFVQVTVHLYDASNQLIGDSTCCYTTPTNIDAGHKSTFDSFVTSDHINGIPVSFRLSFDWS